jgi:hypothetical protein
MRVADSNDRANPEARSTSVSYKATDVASITSHQAGAGWTFRQSPEAWPYEGIEKADDRDCRLGANCYRPSRRWAFDGRREWRSLTIMALKRLKAGD